MAVSSATATATGSCVTSMKPILTVRAQGWVVVLAAGVTNRPIPNIPPPDIPSLICAWWANN